MHAEVVQVKLDESKEAYFCCGHRDVDSSFLGLEDSKGTPGQWVDEEYPCAAIYTACHCATRPN